MMIGKCQMYQNGHFIKIKNYNAGYKLKIDIIMLR